MTCTLLFWSDTVCINQADLDERAQQVSIMGDIYRTASQCIVWLGREYDGSDHAMSLIKDLGQIFPKLGIQELEVRRLTEFNLPSKESPLWRNLYLFFQRPWFQRIWTSQEIIISQTAIFMCGYKNVKLATMMGFACGMEKQSNIMGYLFTPSVVQYGYEKGLTHIMAVGYFRDNIRCHDSGAVTLLT